MVTRKNGRASKKGEEGESNEDRPERRFETCQRRHGLMAPNLFCATQKCTER